MDICKIIIQNVIFPGMEKMKGNQIRKKLVQLQKTEKWTFKTHQYYQVQSLKKLLFHCIHHVPAYQPFISYQNEIEENPLQALEKFPILTKKDFKKDPEKYRTMGVKSEDCIANMTGGSTGEPMHFDIDRETVEWYEAARWQGLGWNGIEIGDRSIMLWNSPIELQHFHLKKYQWKERFLKNRLMIPASDLNPKKMVEYVQLINRYHPVYLYGYASSLFQFAQLMEQHSIQFNFTLKAVVSTSENLYDFQRRTMEKVFQCPIVNEYGARDGGIIAYQCPKGSMHLTMQNGVYEVVDLKQKKRVKYGEKGSLLVTDLHNYVMPRLRYELGDMVSIQKEECSCGINTPILASLDGRLTDTFIAKDGSLINGEYFNQLIRVKKGIQQFQFIQHTPQEITLKIVKGMAFSKEELEDVIFCIKERMGEKNIHIEYVDQILPSASGKVRYAIREYDLES